MPTAPGAERANGKGVIRVKQVGYGNAVFTNVPALQAISRPQTFGDGEQPDPVRRVPIAQIEAGIQKQAGGRVEPLDILRRRPGGILRRRPGGPSTIAEIGSQVGQRGVSDRLAAKQIQSIRPRQ